MYIVLLQNAILLLGLGTLYSLISRLEIRNDILRKIVMGCIFGGVAVAGMQVPFHYAPGIIYDGRSIVLTLAGLFGGGIASITAVVIAAAFRAFLGGAGILAGIATIIGCALTGFLFRRLYKNKPEGLKMMPMYLIGLVSHIVMLAMQMFFLPWPDGIMVVSTIWLPVLIIFPAGTLVMGLFLGNEERQTQSVRTLQQNEEELRRSAEQWQLTYDNVRDAIFILDDNQRVIRSNRAAETLFGGQDGKVTGKCCWELVHGQQMPIKGCPIIKAKESKQRETRKLELGSRWFQVTVDPILNPDGTFSGAVHVMSDITEGHKMHVQLRASERRVKKQRAALADMITAEGTPLDGTAGIYRQVAKSIAETLDTARVCIMKVRQPGELLECVSAYETLSDTWQSGEVVKMAEISGFLGILKKHLRLKAEPHEHPVVWKELYRSFRDPEGIHSLLAHGIVTGGELTGIVLAECKQLNRTWFNDEEAFLDTISSFIAQVFINEERKAIEMEKTRFSKIFEDSLNEVFLFDSSSLLFKQVNQAALDHLGYSMAELESMTPVDIEPFVGRDTFVDLLKPLREGTRTKTVFETVHRRKDGSLYDVEVHLQLMKLEEESFFAAIINDISQRKEAENELRKLKDELEIRVVQRTAELEEERRKLQLSNQELEAFSYSVSHDLRAPLRAINGFSNYLLQDYAGKLDDDGKRMLDIVSGNANRMDRLILDILNLSRISRAELSMENLSISKLAEDVFSNLATEQEKAEFSLRVDPMPTVKGDVVLIRQVLQNLIGNSLKYSSKSDVKKIEVTAVEETDKLNISVRDYGAGFDPEYKSKLFGAFQRLHSDSDFEGTGIGLAIVKRIVHRHGGEVWADGEPGKGAVFSFSLPKSLG